jgi:hypothetical protein
MTPAIARVLVPLVRLFTRAGYIFGTIARRPYLRLLGLRDAAERDLRHGRLKAAAAKASELLKLAERFREDWSYGNAIHHGHLLLGRIALAEGDAATAGNELRAAGRTPGSPQLDSFGPNCRLALDLLRAGERSAVLEYLDLCGRFWKHDVGRREVWLAEVRQGSEPDFGANLVY